MFFKKNILRIKKLLSLSFYFKNPKSHQLVVFDDESLSDLNHIISDFNYFVLKTRIANVTELYISPLIILRLIKNYRGDLWTSYLITIIEIISPKVVLTVIDNSIKFHEVAKFLKKKFIFCAIQNGARYDIKRFKHKFFKKLEKEDLTKKFYIPNFFCFGEFEKDDYNKNNISRSGLVRKWAFIKLNYLLTIHVSVYIFINLHCFYKYYYVNFVENNSRSKPLFRKLKPVALLKTTIIYHFL